MASLLMPLEIQYTNGHHRDTERTEDSQRCKPWLPIHRTEKILRVNSGRRRRAIGEAIEVTAPGVDATSSSAEPARPSRPLPLPRRPVLGPATPGQALPGVGLGHALPDGPLYALIAHAALGGRFLDDDVVGDQKEGKHEDADDDDVPDLHIIRLSAGYKRCTSAWVSSLLARKCHLCESSVRFVSFVVISGKLFN